MFFANEKKKTEVNGSIPCAPTYKFDLVTAHIFMDERTGGERLEGLVQFVIGWVRQERERHRQQARGLSRSERKALSCHFSKEQLEATRTRDVDAIVIPQELRR